MVLYYCYYKCSVISSFNILSLLLLFLFTFRASLGFGVNIEKRFSDIETVSLSDMELENFACVRTFDFDSDFIGFNIGDSLVLVDPLSLL
mgnify:CR=1 FL=1